jgi:hypothetical protein
MAPAKAPSSDPYDFSVVLGGPLYQLICRAHLSGDALEHVRRRMIVISVTAWLPLLILSALGGQAWSGVAVPFVLDVDVHVRFLVTLPLLIAAELVVHRRMRPVIRQFLERDLIPEAARARFDAAAASALRLRNSVVAELLLVAVVYVVALVLWPSYGALDVATWYAVPQEGGRQLSAAGRWFVYVSLPLFQFIFARWYFRLFVWTRFLWQVSRCPLALVPTHPDRVGGLGFLSTTVVALAPVLAAHGSLLSAMIAGRIFFEGAALTDFKVEIAAIVAWLLLVVLGPLLLFGPQLAAARRAGLREYGTLAQRYVREFDRKWLRGGATPDEPLVGSADVQSLADLGNSFELVRSMRFLPFTRDTLLQLVAFTLVPVAPLLLTMISLEDLMTRLLTVLF